MKLTGFLVPLIVIFLLTFGLPLPIHHGSYSKFSLQMALCAMALIAAGAGRVVAVLRPFGVAQGRPEHVEGRPQGRVAVFLRAAHDRLAVLVRAWPFRILVGLVALSFVSALWTGSPEAWRWSVIFLVTNVLWAVLVYLWLTMGGGEGGLWAGYLVSALLASLTGIVLFVIELLYDPMLWGNVTHRLIHPLGGADFMAGFLVAPLLLSIASALRTGDTPGPDALIMDALPLGPLRRRCPAALLADLSVVLLLALGLTGSRGGALGLAAGLFVLIVLLMQSRRARYGTVACVAALFLAGLLALLLVPSLHAWAAAHAKTGTNVVRYFLWGDAGRMIAARPILGWGAGGFSAFHATIKLPEEYQFYYLRFSAIAPHNEFLGYGVEYGLVGMALYAAFILGLAGRALRRARSGRWNIAQKAVLAGFVGLNVQSFFDVGLRFWDLAPFFWMLVGALFAFTEGKEPLASTTDADPARASRTPAGLTIALAILTGAVGVAWCVFTALDLVGQRQVLTAIRARNSGRVTAAGMSYEAALRKLIYFPDRVTARLLLSECQQAENRILDAIATLEELKTQAPNERGTNLKLGLLYMQAADQERAIAERERAAWLSSGAAGLVVYLRPNALGLVYMLAADQRAASQAERAEWLDSAAAALATYLQTNMDAQGYRALARVFVRQSPCGFNEAVLALQKYLSLSDPKNSSLPPADAEKRALSPKATPAAYLELAAFWQAAGNKAKAREVLQTAAKRFPGERAIGEAMNQLEEQKSKP